LFLCNRACKSLKGIHNFYPKVFYLVADNLGANQGTHGSMLSISPTIPQQTQSQQAQQKDITGVHAHVDSDQKTHANNNPAKVVNEAKSAEKNTNTKDPNLEFTEAEKQILNELKARDREVRAHEQAHAAAAGSLAKGGPSYEYQKGPDGQLYAIGGHISIDVSIVPGDPKATLEKAEKIQRAALAPAQPSAQDRAVAANASSMAAEARVEIRQEAIEQQQTDNVSEFDLSTDEKEETEAICAECGGQHASASHTTSIALHETFNSNIENEQNALIDIAA